MELKRMCENNHIPHILLYGPSGGGKKTLLFEYMKMIYGDEYNVTRILVVNCSHGKGIKFIREELQQFAKNYIRTDDGMKFKSVLLLNGDMLTQDAQSALRCCIEVYSHNTRFFLTAETTDAIMQPIASRFHAIYVPLPPCGNLYQYNIQKEQDVRVESLKKDMLKQLNREGVEISDIMEYGVRITEKGFHLIDLLNVLEYTKFLESIINDDRRLQLLTLLHNIKKDFRHEKLLITILLTFIFISSEHPLENVLFM